MSSLQYHNLDDSFKDLRLAYNACYILPMHFWPKLAFLLVLLLVESAKIFAISHSDFLKLSAEERYAHIKGECSQGLRGIVSEPLWAFEKFLPGANTFGEFVQRVDQVSRARLPRLDSKEMKLIKTVKSNLFDGRGVNSDQLLIYRFRNKLLHLKVKSSEYTDDGDSRNREESILLQLNALGIGSRLIGVTEHNERLSFGTQYIPFFLETKYIDSESDSRTIVYQSAIDEILATGRILREIGFIDACDLDFLISADGRQAILIDPEYFSKRDTRGKEDPIKSTEKIAEDLRQAFEVLPN